MSGWDRIIPKRFVQTDGANSIPSRLYESSLSPLPLHVTHFTLSKPFLPHMVTAWMVLAMITLSTVSALGNGLPDSVSRLASQTGISDDSISLVVREANSNRTVLSVHPDTPRNPASVIKLVTTIAAMELLGPAYQWETQYLVNGEVDSTGTLRGNLILQGGGDPFLTTERFWHHLLALRQRGIRHIDGNLIIDNTRFDLRPHDRAAFDNRPLRLYNVGPDAALTNFSATRMVIEPLGGRIHVFADPPLAGLVIHNHLRPARGACANPGEGWSMDLDRSGGQLQVSFRGLYRTRCGQYSLSRSYFRNPEYTYRLFRSLWESMGGMLTGGYRTGSVPESATPVVRLKSRSLAENVAGINKYSNNVMARQLLLTLGREAAGESGEDTVDNGIEAVMQWLDQVGVNTDGMVIENGAGLSRRARATATQIADLLQVAWHSNWQPEIAASLSLLGIDGTMRRRLQKTDLAGRARIKTGLVKGVRSMAGYVHARNGRFYTVTLLIHSPKVHYWNGNRLQRAILEWVYQRPS